VSSWLFIAGAGSTGKSLLSKCLHHHPAIAMCTHESEIALQMLRMFQHVQGWDPAPIQWSCGAARFWDTAHLFGYGPDMEVEFPAKDLARAALHGLTEHLDPMKHYLGDASSAYVYCWPLLRDICPGCRFVFVRREVEATIEDWLRKGHGKSRNDDRAMIRAEIERRNTSALKCPDATWASLEGLLATPREALTMVLEWLDLPPDEMNWQGVYAEIGDPSDGYPRAGLAEPDLPDLLPLWREDAGNVRR
jgi:hypothetical protein